MKNARSIHFYFDHTKICLGTKIYYTYTYGSFFRPEIKVEEEEPERPKISEQDIIEKARELKKKREEEERKIVEEKHLQLFM